jgi:hypothetical protein
LYNYKQIYCNTKVEALTGYSSWEIIILLLFSLAFPPELRKKDCTIPHRSTSHNLRKWPKRNRTISSPMTDFRHYLAENHWLQRGGNCSLAVARRWRQLGGGAAAPAPWRRRRQCGGGGGSAAADPAAKYLRKKLLTAVVWYTRCAWAGGTFVPVVLLCQFFGFWREIGFGVTYLRI